MTLRKLASLIAKKESKKHEASVGDIREILAILSDIIYEDALCEKDNNIYSNISVMLYLNGMRRIKKK